MLWLFIALQAITPFIHAHAGAVQLDHTGFMHLHQSAQGDVVWHAAVTDDHGTEVAVAAGVPLRHTLGAAPADRPAAAVSTLLPICDSTQRLDRSRAPPAPRVALRAHTLPHALAPPAH